MTVLIWVGLETFAARVHSSTHEPFLIQALAPTSPTSPHMPPIVQLRVPTAADDLPPTAGVAPSLTPTCPLLPVREFPFSVPNTIGPQPELSNAAFAARWVAPVVDGGGADDRKQCPDADDLRAPQHPESTVARAHDPFVHAVVPPPFRATTSTIGYISPFLHDAALPDASTLEVPTAYEGISPDAHPLHTQTLPHDIVTLRDRLAQVGAAADPPYRCLRACLGRTCSVSPSSTTPPTIPAPMTYVFRHTYYRDGRTHGFQVEWELAPSSASSLRATVVAGRVVGNYLPGEADDVVHGTPSEFAHTSTTSTADRPMLHGASHLPYAQSADALSQIDQVNASQALTDPRQHAGLRAREDHRAAVAAQLRHPAGVRPDGQRPCVELNGGPWEAERCGGGTPHDTPREAFGRTRMWDGRVRLR